MRLFVCALLLLFCFKVSAQPQTDALLRNILLQNTNPLYQNVVAHPDEYRLQIIYTQINRDKHNKPSFTHYHFHVDPQQYYYPASVVKLPLAALSLEKLHEIHKKALPNLLRCNSTVLIRIR